MPYKNSEDRQLHLKEYRIKNGKQIDARRKLVLEKQFEDMTQEQRDQFLENRRQIAMKSYYKHRDKRLLANKERNFKYQLKWCYDITYDDYLLILKSQNNKCAICGCGEFEKRWTSTKLPFAVDHCHKTNKVRGLLCDNCNVLIGHAKEDIEILKNAMDYLWKQNDITAEN